MTRADTFILAHQFHPDIFAQSWLTLVGVPLIVGALIVGGLARSAEDDTGRGPGLWATGIYGALTGLLVPAVWLTWNGYHQTPLDAHLPGPRQFPAWQIVALTITFLIATGVIALKMRRPFVGAVALAVGTGVGAATAMIIEVSFFDTTSQEGIGIFLALIGGGLLGWSVGGIIGIPRGIRAGLSRKNRNRD
ncbi:hypothetical protein [Corynebacterium auriscanis]|uniref:hypothetical protein n=1 Tax=Corynebacterium auriscanis TaxID=99807 RepID=UPI0024ACCCB9|nr:hypothetical protein [Corynebacterium auriscanis]